MNKVKIDIEGIESSLQYTGKTLHKLKKINDEVVTSPLPTIHLRCIDDVLFVVIDHILYTQASLKEYVKLVSIENKNEELEAIGVKFTLYKVEEESLAATTLYFYFSPEKRVNVEMFVEKLLRFQEEKRKGIRSNSFTRVKNALLKGEQSIIERSTEIVLEVEGKEEQTTSEEQGIYLDSQPKEVLKETKDEGQEELQEEPMPGMVLKLKEDYLHMYLRKNFGKLRALSLVCNYWSDDEHVFIHDGVMLYLLAKEEGFKPSIKIIDEQLYLQVEVYQYGINQHFKKVVLDLAIDEVDEANAFLVYYQTLQISFDEEVMKSLVDKFYLLSNERLQYQVKKQENVNVMKIFRKEVNDHWYFYLFAILVIVVLLVF